jgi:hypothetical protein
VSDDKPGGRPRAICMCADTKASHAHRRKPVDGWYECKRVGCDCKAYVPTRVGERPRIGQEHMARVAELEQQLASGREAKETADAALRDGKQNHDLAIMEIRVQQQRADKAETRAMQAEREREEERTRADADYARFLEAQQGRERAEADSAALLDDISEAARLLREGHDPAKAGQVLAGSLIVGRRGAALLEELRALRGVVQAFRDAEWTRSSDWQGFCPFRRSKEIGCRGTDGHSSAVGSPKPVPHDEHCPYHALHAAESHESAGPDVMAELRALRKVREACEPFRGKEADSISRGLYAHAPMFTAQARALLEACDAADALRGKT